MKRVPVLTLVLIAANLAAAFALFRDPDLAFRFGFRADAPSLSGAFVGLFLHGNLFHLLGNLLFLAAVGAAVELATGSVRFAAVYFGSGLAGVGLHWVVTQRAIDPAPLVGASGAIAGCAAYYGIRYVGLKVAVAPHRGASVLAIVLTWAGLQAIGAVVRFGETTGTAFWSHLGGLAAGAFLSLIFRAPDIAELKISHEVLAQMNSRGPSASFAAARQHLKKHPNDVRALHELARASAQLEDLESESEAILHLLRLSPEMDRPSLLTRLVEIGQASKVASARRLVIAEQLKGDYGDVARMLLRSILTGPANDGARPEALLTLAGMEREREPELARTLLDELAKTYPVHPCTDLAKQRGWLA